jgi:hypothetical protein
VGQALALQGAGPKLARRRAGVGPKRLPGLARRARRGWPGQRPRRRPRCRAWRFTLSAACRKPDTNLVNVAWAARALGPAAPAAPMQFLGRWLPDPSRSQRLSDEHCTHGRQHTPPHRACRAQNLSKLAMSRRPAIDAAAVVDARPLTDALQPSAANDTRPAVREEVTAQARTPISSEASLRMRLLRLPLAVGVVFVHCAGTAVHTAQGSLALGDVGFFGRLLRDICSQGIARSSVLISLLMAGYLLAMGLDGSLGNYADKLRSKLRTLLLPFLFWNLLVLGLYALAQALPATAAFMSGRHAPIADYSLGDLFSAVLGIGREPIAYPLWFIRDLMLLVVLAPLLLRALKVVPGPVLLLLFALWLTDLWPLYMPSSRATLFFCLGLHLGANCKTGAGLFSLDPYLAPMAAAYAALVLASAMPVSAPWQPYLHELTIALGVPVILCASKLVLKSPALQRHLLRWSVASFFVFAAHEPLLTVVLKLTYSALPPVNAAWATLLYFLLPGLLICFLVQLHRALALVLPNFTAWITGGRK